MAPSFDYDPTKKDPAGKWLWVIALLILITIVLLMIF